MTDQKQPVRQMRSIDLTAFALEHFSGHLSGVHLGAMSRDLLITWVEEQQQEA